MSDFISKPITWESVFRVAFVWGTEYALLSLIEDAPASLKVATMVCSLGSLAILEWREPINARQSFLATMLGVIVLCVWIYFIVYALRQNDKKTGIQTGLRQLYVQAERLTSMERPKCNVTPPSGGDTQVAKDFTDEVRKWEKETVAFIGKNFGEAATYRFLDRSNTNQTETVFCSIFPLYEEMAQDLAHYRANLSVLIETRAYDAP